MNQETHLVVPPDANNEIERWLSQLLWIVGVSAAMTFGYAFYSESALFRGVGLQLLLMAITLWSTKRVLKIPRDREMPQAEIVERWSLHFIFTASPLVLLLIGVLMSLLVGRVEVARPLSPQEIATSAILAVLAASLWTALGKITQGSAVSAGNWLHSVIMTLHEARIGWFAAAFVQLASSMFPAISQWLAVVIQVYLVVVISESLFRLILAWFRLERIGGESEEAWPDPLDSMIREICFSSWNPLDTFFRIAESRFGVSLRSSWSIRYFRRAVPIALLLVVLLCWLSTAVVVVQPDQLALCERIGQIDPAPLEPGLHVIYPWPLGKVRRTSVGHVQTVQIGFTQPVDEAAVIADRPRSLLWTDPHANEFALVLGTQSELISINAQIYFQVGRSVEQLKDYLVLHADPVGTLEAIAYQVLREETQHATLDQILSENRQAFSDRISAKVAQKVNQMQLGIEIVEVSLLSLHPPVEAATAYLDVSNAESDAQRLVIEARGNAEAKLLTAQKESTALVAAAKQEAAKRIGLAGQEASHFEEASKAYQAAPETYRVRLWFDTYENTLPGKQVYIIDDQLEDVLITEPNAKVNPTVIGLPTTPKSSSN
ncbi:SPFH domain-containing protein [Blastopirellula marina]|uniref:Band 7 domain-containing protein n=1 Tax=Blastopirellula marina TaxID=124 RepID=A0A2S8G0R0_9BACT|nr:SPFH domain-containing protein [Blastopirellula marina]PQO38035.1 hypothetical protein C5Y98_08075 [Blastopirellula marina]PTL44691.1 hypothetical protein C5Y97_08075 [Blastopirellula marina]